LCWSFQAIFQFQNRTEIIDLLLKRGADPLIESSDQMTALTFARKMEAQAAAEQLSALQK
jgi:ankyrin repeat protein